MASTAESKCSGSDPALKLGTSDVDMNAEEMRTLIAEHKRVLEELQKQANAWQPGRATRSSDPLVFAPKPEHALAVVARPAAQGTPGSSRADQAAVEAALAEALGCDSDQGAGKQVASLELATSRSHKTEWNRPLRRETALASVAKQSRPQIWSAFGARAAQRGWSCSESGSSREKTRQR